MTVGVAYWGGQFPDAALTRYYWAQHFSDKGSNPTLVAAVGQGTVGQLPLLFADLKIKWSWQNDVFKSYSGLETRSALLTLPRATFEGSMPMLGTDAVAMRATLQRYAASGGAFLMGLPHEELTLAADAGAGTVLTVGTTTLSDWMVPGQRVIVRTADYSQTAQAVIQSTTSTTVVVDVAPGATIGKRGGAVMPAMAVLLDSKQGFVRHPAPAVGTTQGMEVWNFTARQIMFGHENSGSIAAFVKLAPFTSGHLAGVTLVFRDPGVIGNAFTFQIFSGGTPIGLSAPGGTNYQYRFNPGVTTLQNFLDALKNGTEGGTAGQIYATGTIPYNLTGTLMDATDVFGPVSFAGGVDKVWGTMGAGATVTTYNGHPVWDRPVTMGAAGNPVGDSMQSFADVNDLGGLPFSMGVATQPDLGRKVQWERTSQAEWQWLKAMLYTISGRRKAFWLPTWRADLTPVQLVPGQLKISSSYGNYGIWSNYRGNLQLIDSAGVVRYFTVTTSVDNGDGTMTLSVTCSDATYNTGGGGSTMSSFQLLSWLDLCRFEQDELEVAVAVDGFTFSADARAVQR